MSFKNYIKVFFAQIGKVRGTDGVVSDGQQRNFHLYKGIATCKLLAVNPSKEEMGVLFGRKVDKEYDYFKKIGENPCCTLNFIFNTIPEDCDGVDLRFSVMYNLVGVPRYTNDKQKIMVINQFGGTAWLPIDNVKNKTLPDNMKWFEGDFKPCFNGEDDLVALFKAVLNIPDKSFIDNSGNRQQIENISDAVLMLDDIKNYFNGNIQEIHQLVKLSKDQRFKLLLGVRTTDDNKQYQTIFKELPMRIGTRSTNYLNKKLQEAFSAGKYSNVDFGEQPFELIKLENRPTVPVTNNSNPDPVKPITTDDLPW